MGDVDYRPDHRGTGQLMQTTEMHGAVELVCYDSVGFARPISPDAPPYGEGYVASFHVDAGHTERIAKTRRAVAYLVNDSDHATIVEVGLHGEVGHHVLAKTLDHIEGVF